MTDKSNEQIYAPFSVRFAAFLIDLVVSFGIFVVFIFIGLGYNDRCDCYDGEVFGFLLGVSSIFSYYLYSGYYNQATLGKYWLNLKIVNYEGKKVSLPEVFGRFVIFALTLFFPPILLMIHFTERKQGLHDFICKTYVMQELTPDLLNKD